GNGEDVLDGDRHAHQGAEIMPVRHETIHALCRLERNVLADLLEGPECGVESANSGEIGSGRRLGRQAPGPERRGKPGKSQASDRVIRNSVIEIIAHGRASRSWRTSLDLYCMRANSKSF